MTSRHLRFLRHHYVQTARDQVNKMKVCISIISIITTLNVTKRKLRKWAYEIHRTKKLKKSRAAEKLLIVYYVQKRNSKIVSEITMNIVSKGQTYKTIINKFLLDLVLGLLRQL